MRLRHWLSGAAGAVALGMFSLSAQAAPLTGPGDAARANAGRGGLVQNVHWVRRCYWHRGHRHCRRVWRRWGGYPYHHRRYYRDYGPGFSFYFGPRRHYHW
jgi:Ni/Co efflux regulator RcnB